MTEGFGRRLHNPFLRHESAKQLLHFSVVPLLKPAECVPLLHRQHMFHVALKAASVGVRSRRHPPVQDRLVEVDERDFEPFFRHQLASVNNTDYINGIVYRVNEKGIVFLATAEIRVTGARMGRKPMNMKPTPVRLSAGALARIDAVVGNYGRAGFIRDAVEAELERRERIVTEGQDAQRLGERSE